MPDDDPTPPEPDEALEEARRLYWALRDAGTDPERAERLVLAVYWWVLRDRERE